MVKVIKKKNRISIISIIVLTLSFILFYCAAFINYKFNNISFEQLLYTIKEPKGGNNSIVFTGLFYVFVRILITYLIIYLLYKLYKKLNIKIVINVGFNKKVLKINILKLTKLKSNIYIYSFLVLSLFCICRILGMDEYIKSQINSSKIFEEYYVDARDTKIEFPKEKQNLIYIYLESFEMSSASVENGGYLKKTYIPKLENIALDNINFSDTSKLGGAYQINNTNWTIAAIMAHTAGIPLKLSIDGNLYKNFSGSFPGVYNLGDILNENGYNNYFMIGSDAEFGGRKDYFEKHGNYKIYDYNYAKQQKYIDEDYFVWWGYEDKKLFEFAKKELLKISKKEEPFNFTMLTVDTHFVDGYMDDSCKEVFKEKYANSIYCSDNKVYNFIKWIQKQDFYDNTTIIITGDHLVMQNELYGDSDRRRIYNSIINSKIEPKKEKNRVFSTLDMFPTTLASLGVKIKGDRLGLGVNLFSDEETLLEELGIDKVNEEISKKSFFYDNVLLGDTYYEMKENFK